MGLVLPNPSRCRLVFNKQGQCWEVQQGMIIVCRGHYEKCQQYININKLQVSGHKELTA